MEKQVTIQSEMHPLAATLHYPTRAKDSESCLRYPAVVICHGFVGSRIGVNRLFVKTARALASRGYLVARFDYSGCGESEGEYGSSRFEDFVSQTRHVLDYVCDMDCVDIRRITLLGHSLGGAIALFTAVQDRRVSKLALWSAVGHPFRDIVQITGIETYDHAVKEGEADYLGYSFQGRFFASLSEHQPFKIANQFQGDVLLIHGTSDEVIPTDYAFLYQKLFWMRNGWECEKEIIFQADHTYSTGEHAMQAIDKTADWLEGMERKKEEWNGWMI
ncbi:alpha/beta fold hydrolase [Xylanibacillus composti]|uniref:Alpha/beta hydrolase n=1 Tax=Xylanibacillus composti TaxID=1572762 RepID=A0A8J4M2X5_9BACL|nr:alpha/beta fold hydrolase [Xylanibacillus composti]MDT9726974.1 alpha/beta fold hydrolase [Xylanibacillus composti]GIQ69530.1 alpha/beta hydrolase [Xylanibacillus composti]